MKKNTKYKEKPETTEELEDKIMLKIKKSVIEKKNELEIINSEIFILKENSDSKKTKEQLNEEHNKIKELLNRIAEIKEKLSIYTNDRLIEDAIYLDSKNVIDDILDYKKLVDAKESLREEYELIEEYGTILSEIDRINDKCIELDKNTNDYLGLQELNDQEFAKLETNALKEDNNINSINDIINEQIELIKELDDKVGVIEEEKEILYNYEMFKELMRLELKYIALMSLSPLKGTIPYIAISAAQTKNTINLLLSGPLVTTEEKINYIAKDYMSEIENAEYKLNDIESSLNDSLSSINNIKEKIKNNDMFKNNPKYESLISKMESIEEFLEDNNSKIDIYKTKLNKNKKKNKETMTKIRILNKN